MTAGVVECPHCREPTMPNRLADGSTVCSCAAERALPPGDAAPPAAPPRRAAGLVPFPRRPPR